MRSVQGPLPKSKGWAFETKWKGLRALLTNEPGLTVLHDENGRDVSAAFPEIRRIGRAIGAEDVILDGVITCAGGKTSLDRRLAAKSDSTVRRIAKDQPAVYVAFDLIWQEGHPRWELPWSERRQRLEALELDGDNWKVPTAHVGDGKELVEAARSSGVDALFAKRTSSPYTPGAESPDWVEIQL
jgi:bifunctional non-homologous end joining protein LigD